MQQNYVLDIHSHSLTTAGSVRSCNLVTLSHYLYDPYSNFRTAIYDYICRQKEF